MNQKIQDWLELSSKSVSVRNPISIHIDDLLGAQLEKDDIVNISTKAFLSLNKQIGQQQLTVIPLLVIPLRVIGNELSLAAPANLPILKNQLGDEPPSLYLLSRDSLRLTEACEEYKYPLPFELIPSLPKDVYVYFREFRNSQAIKNQWEFSRCVYVQRNPMF
jgi:hypothetical protein